MQYSSEYIQYSLADILDSISIKYLYVKSLLNNIYHIFILIDQIAKVIYIYIYKVVNKLQPDPTKILNYTEAM